MISISNLSKTYKKENAQPVFAVQNITLHIERGDFTAIVGPSGSGKSTLMNILGLLDVPDSGSYQFEGKEVSLMTIDELADIRNSNIGFVFQQFHLLPKISAKENVELPLIYSNRTNIGGMAENVLAQVGLKERMHHTSAELSGGQQQRVAIARALVNDPDILLADEPTGNLDSESGTEIINIFKQLHSSGKTIILITHDMNIASHAQKILKIVDGKLLNHTAVS
ncbi:MAG: ABC transporter ATP-binding protein [Ignavibacteriales bacterium]|nr:ABC transporter ATP-binding protein [Ignavibacteriales bacterium]